MSWEDDGSDEEGEGEGKAAKGKAKPPAITSFFGKKGAPAPAPRHRYFQERNIRVVTDF